MTGGRTADCLKKIARLSASACKLAELMAFPSFCKLCSRLLVQDKENGICSSCLQKIKPASSSCCIRCGRFFPSDVASHICIRCLEKEPPFSVHRSCGVYREILRDIILIFKYHGYRSLGKPLALFCLAVLGEENRLWTDLDMIIPIPLHSKRKRQRGFNQARILAKTIAKEKKLVMECRSVIRIKYGPPQSTLDARKRALNLRGAFRVKKKKLIQHKKILLVDDVFTTGATLNEISRTLHKAGAEEIRALSIAQPQLHSTF